MVCKSVFRSWDWTSNGACCNKGTRIIVGWNPRVLDVMVLFQSSQVMHIQLSFKLDKRVVFCSIVYAANYYVTRRELWQQLSMHKAFVGNRPWTIMGDFNSALNLEDCSLGSSSISVGMREFRECIDSLEMFDINKSGLHFTWSQKPKEGIGLLKKIDRVLGNTPLVTAFPNSVAMFHPYRISDHCPCILKLPEAGSSKPRSFKFANFLVHKPEFIDIVKKAWESRVDGVFQFQVVKRLRMLKSPLRALLYKQGNLHQKVEVIRQRLDHIQLRIDGDPLNSDLRAEEAVLNRDFQAAALDEERFLKQKSKVDWLIAGDMNSAYFHSSLKVRNHYSHIEIIKDSQGVLHENDDVPHAFVSHYENFLGSQCVTSLSPGPDLFSMGLSPTTAAHMVRSVTQEEVKAAMFSIGIDKAPGPDGFTAAFFKSAWPVIGDDISNAIIDFFGSGKLLRELNHTMLVLIPKIPTPLAVTDYRPIACCNVLYKCISKIIADRIKKGLNEIVSVNQSAFVPGRKITDNILLTQELMHNYHRNVGPPRCAFKVDIQKAYDTVDWKFLRSVLIGFGFNVKMVEWIMVCVSTTTYSVCVNGNVHGFFKGNRGLRQGDPMSPYLFTLVMEVLTRILHETIRIDSSFRFHNKCERQQIVNLCFADDLFLFARGDVNSAKCIMSSLNKFTKMSGLAPNSHKSTVFFCNVPISAKNAILDVLPFVEGKLPVRYLGVPLICSKLSYKDCSSLVEMLEKRITNWRNKLLSFAGRLQLISSVLSSMHVYWSSVFVLPSRVIKDLETRMRNFLWSQDASFHRGKAKVSWKTVCTPKFEGGLGIRRIGDMNVALMTSHVGSILSRRNSLWVDWVHDHRLKDKNFWMCKIPSNSSWSWRKLLQLRQSLRPYMWTKIGNGEDTSAWYDKWCDIGPLGNFLTPRTITNAGFRLDNKVVDVQTNGVWSWPVAWRDLFPVLNQIDNVHIELNKQDKLLWRDGDDFDEVTTSGVWNSIRYRSPEVEWGSLVWFAQCIPRHAFLMWLIMRGKLLTQDKILQWGIERRKNMNMMCCMLCYQNNDSHSHLFFECPFSAQVWISVRQKVDMVSVQPKWTDIIDWLLPRARSRSVANYAARLLVAASAYIIWQERNARIFKNQMRPPEVISEVILNTVRYKLMGAKLRKTAKVQRWLGEWKIGSNTISDDGVFF
uniref:Putative RNA-directed DNA polymerase, eukaryota, Reverse transcriptase zinc-binding domain protein n=1 Tax=Helianthus annuus TaxID=4232 RepID=A0A251VNU9_HELAN